MLTTPEGFSEGGTTELAKGLEAAGNTKFFVENITVTLKEGLVMAMGILPSILSVGLIGLLLAKYTPVFDVI